MGTPTVPVVLRDVLVDGPEVELELPEEEPPELGGWLAADDPVLAGVEPNGTVPPVVAVA